MYYLLLALFLTACGVNTSNNQHETNHNDTTSNNINCAQNPNDPSCRQQITPKDCTNTPNLCPQTHQCNEQTKQCEPRCAADKMCGGICCTNEQSCYNDVCAPTCTTGTFCHVDDTGHSICCNDSTETCIAKTCVTKGDACQPSENIYCQSSAFCDESSQTCIDYSQFQPNQLCLHEYKADADPVKKLTWKGWYDAQGATVHEEQTHEQKKVIMGALAAPLNDDETSDILFVTKYGTLYAVSGVPFSNRLPDDPKGNARTLWSSIDPHPAYNYRLQREATTPAIADINHDGKVEIIALSDQDTVLLINGQTGQLIKESEDTVKGAWPGTSVILANLDRKGPPEIIVGGTIFDTQLNKICDYATDFRTTSIPIAVDLDGDETSPLEIIDSGRVYRYVEKTTGDGYDCVLQTPEPTTIERGHFSYSAVVNFKQPPYDPHKPEIVTVSDGSVYITDHTGSVFIKTIKLPYDKFGGPPAIADFDGDQELDIAFAAKNYIYVYNAKGELLWKYLSPNSVLGTTGVGAFDFDGDGKAELLHNNETHFIIFDGAGGDPETNPSNGKRKPKILLEKENNTGTRMQKPTVVDLEQDGHADVILTSSNNDIGITVYTSQDWTGTRSIWNQNGYHQTNILNNLTIPENEKTYWQNPLTNSFEQNNVTTNRLKSELSVKWNMIQVSDCQTSHLKSLNFTILNEGQTTIPANTVKIDILAKQSEDASSPFTSQLTMYIDANLKPNQHFNKKYQLDLSKTPLLNKKVDLKIIVDPDNKINECDENNNEAIIQQVNLQCE